MRQKTLFDFAEAGERNATSEGGKRHRYDKGIDSFTTNIANREQKAGIEQLLPAEFFSLSLNEQRTARARSNQREVMLFCLKNQSMQKNWSWSRFRQDASEGPLPNRAMSHVVAQDIYRNSIVDISSDSTGQIFFALQRSGVNIFSTNLPCRDTGLETWNTPVLRLDSITIQEHRSWYPGRAIFFGCSRFIGKSLFVACGYLGAPVLEVYDLEDVDEATCDPLNSFDLNQMQRDCGISNLFLEEGAPFATDIISFSANLLAVALSSGESAWIDLRQKNVIQCTPRVGTRLCGQDLLDMRLSQQTSSPLSCIAFSSVNPTLLVTGAKDGKVALWDVRFPKEFIVTYRSQSEIARLWVYTGHGSRRGCPQVWFNNFRGDIVGLAMSDTLLSEIFSIKTEDSTRDNFSNNIATQKLSLSGEGVLFYPHLSRNCLFALDIEAGVRNFPSNVVQYVPAHNNVRCSSDRTQKSVSRFVSEPVTHIDNILNTTTLTATFPFSQTGEQVSACSIFDDQLSFLVGSSVGDLCMIKNNFAC